MDPTLVDDDAQRFIENLADHKQDQLDLMCEFMGSCLTPGHTALAYICSCLDDGRGRAGNGKSQLLNLIEQLAGSRNVSNLGPDDLTGNFSLIDPRATSLIKKIASGGSGTDTVSADVKYDSRQRFKPTTTFGFCTSTIPKFTQADIENSALDRRTVVVPLTNPFEDGSPDRDPQLVARVLGDKSTMSGSNRSLMYLFVLAVRGLKRLHDNGWQFTKTAYSRRLELRIKTDNDSSAQFLSEFSTPLSRKHLQGEMELVDFDSILVKDHAYLAARSARLGTKEGEPLRSGLVDAWYLVYKRWCEEQGNRTPLSKSRFTASMKDKSGLDTRNTSWVAKGADGKTRTYQSRRYVSKENYKTCASGLMLPQLDAMNEEESAALESDVSLSRHEGASALDDVNAIRHKEGDVRKSTKIGRSFEHDEATLIKAYQGCAPC